MRDCKRNDPTKSALSKHVTETLHEPDWLNARPVQFETNRHKRIFLESYHINSKPHTMNDKRTTYFPAVYGSLLQQ